MIPCVLLDMDDTLLDFKKAEARALSKSLTELGIGHDETVLRRYSQINLEHWERLENGEITREQVLLGRFQQLLSELREDNADPVELRDRYEYNLSQGHDFVEGAEEVLKILFDRYRLFLVSNGTAIVQKGRLASAGITPFFERIFISEEIGVNKPEREYFERCFRQIPDFDRNRCVIVGDSLTSDIRGGINAGIHTCWFNLRNNPQREGITPEIQIHTLSELPAALENLFSL